MNTLHRGEIRLLMGYTAFHTYNYFIVIRIPTLKLSISGSHFHTSFSGGRDQEDNIQSQLRHIFYIAH
jgi:hypothetical protein